MASPYHDLDRQLERIRNRPQTWGDRILSALVLLAFGAALWWLSGGSFGYSPDHWR